MTTYSRSDLAAKALRLPGLYGPDEAISGEDQEDAEAMAEAIVETLAEMNIYIPNGSVDVVPASWYIPLANFIGMYLVQSYGGPSPTEKSIQDAASPLRTMSAKPETGSILEAQYF